MEKELLVSGKKIFYRVYGNGRPVILLHGFGETGDVWKNQIDFLQHNYLLIVPDLPGSGRSEMIEDMSMEGMAEIIKPVLDAASPSGVGHPPGGREAGVVLIGHSMGGYITLAFAEKYPSFLRAFGLFHSTAYADSEEKKATRRKGIEFIRTHGAFEFLRTTSPNLFAPATKAENQALIDSFIRSLNNFSAPSLVSYYEAMIKRPERTAVLKTAGVPVLFIMGKYDTAIPPDDVLKQCSLPEKAYIHILGESAHMGMLEEADYSNEILNKFFTDTWLF